MALFYPWMKFEKFGGANDIISSGKVYSSVDFILKMPLAPSKWLFRWIKEDKWDYFYFCSQEMEIINHIHFF